MNNPLAPSPVARPLRILVVGHSLVNRLNRRRLDALAAHPDLAITAIVPDRWTGSMGEEYRPAEDAAAAAARAPGYALLARRAYFSGTNRQHLYLYGASVVSTMRASAPDLVHVEEEPYSLITFQIGLAARAALRRPFVFTTFQNLRKSYPPPFAQTQAWVLRNAGAALIGADAAGRVLRARGFAGPMTPFALGFDPADYRPAPDPGLRRALGLTPGFTAGFVGRLETIKGVHLLLRALAGLPAAQLIAVGCGSQAPALARLARELGVSARVAWVDRVPHEDVPRYLNGMDCLVLPALADGSIAEQFGRVLVEAMACEVPVVGSSAGEIATVVGGAGIIVPEGDVPALAAALAGLAGSPERRLALARAGRARALERYAWPVIARDVARLYRDVASRAEGGVCADRNAEARAR
jgi:glycosyltransferase involved in cell wall biosynthesis